MAGQRPLGLGSIILLVFALFVPQSASSLPDGRLGVLYVGCFARSAPFEQMKNDPFFSMSYVPATFRDWVAVAGLTIDDTKRMIRLYMPRTLERLTSRFDVVALANANRMGLGTRNVEMIAKGVREEGVGFFMSGSFESFGANAGYPAWGDSAIGEILPTEDVVDTWPQCGRLVLDAPDHELLSSVPWDDPALKHPDKWDHNLVTVKPGANQIAHLLWKPGVDHPLMVTWEVEGGATVFALTSEISRLTWTGDAWEYDYDFGSNLMIYLDGRPVPQETEIVHRARSKILEIADRRKLVIDLLQFSESFGANTHEVMNSLGEVDEVISQASEQYIDLQYQEMLETNEIVVSMLQDLQQEAVELKNHALMWVYLIEWLAVTGTALVCGFVLWTVMVRRKLYRQVKVTRGR